MPFHKPSASWKLRQAQADGHAIVCALPAYDGQAVQYQPRFHGDPTPWLSPTMHRRFTGKECRLACAVYV